MDAQSPINLDPTVRARSTLKLHLLWGGASGFVHQGDHGTQVVFEQPSPNTAEFEGRTYVLRQFHFHHPSEHFLEGKQFDGELHIVHQDLGACAYLVLGVFLKVGAKRAARDVEFFKSLPQSRGAGVPTHPSEWLPLSAKRVLRYEGSLTTEPYSESVTWLVFRRPLEMTTDQFALIFGKRHGGGSAMQGARPLQPINRRYVLEYKSDLAIELASP